MKDIKTFENLYQISENGIVKALERKVNMPNGGMKIIKEHYPEQKAKREAEAKEAAELKAKQDAERKAKAAPDKAKLNDFAKMLDELVLPELKSEEANKVLSDAKTLLAKVSNFIREKSSII